VSIEHRVSMEAQPIADQWLLRCTCGWVDKVSLNDFTIRYGARDEAVRRKDLHESINAKAAVKLYAERDVLKQGQHYVRHVEAMTAEGLHSKADIAAELAHRDIQIEQLTRAADALVAWRRASESAKRLADLNVITDELWTLAGEIIKARGIAIFDRLSRGENP
jgi:hypothetical protein